MIASSIGPMHAGPLFDEWPFQGLTPQGYGLLMADPPWAFQLFSELGEEKSAQAQYEVMELGAIKALPVADLAAENALLWMWATNPMLAQAIDTMRAWGFELKTAGTWIKTTSGGKLAFGTGYILRSASEPFLIGTRGSPKTARNVRSCFYGQVRRHSEKPSVAYSIAGQLVPGVPRVELFSRTSREGWATWGLEAGKFDKMDRKSSTRKQIQKSDEGQISAQIGLFR